LTVTKTAYTAQKGMKAYEIFFHLSVSAARRTKERTG